MIVHEILRTELPRENGRRWYAALKRESVKKQLEINVSACMPVEIFNYARNNASRRILIGFFPISERYHTAGHHSNDSETVGVRPAP